MLGRCEEPLGEAVERLGRDLLEHEPALLRPARELAAGAVELAVARQDAQLLGSRADAAAVSRTQEIVRVRGEDDRSRACRCRARRATWACASGQTSPITLSHLSSASRAASFHASVCPSKLASGHKWWLCAAKCSRSGLAPRLRENRALKLKDRSSSPTIRGRCACRASSADKLRRPSRRCRACCR